MRAADLLRLRVPASASLAAAVITPVLTTAVAIVAARAVHQRDAAIAHLADALAENASAAWEEHDVVTAELLAAGALALTEQPRARGVAMQAAATWRPVVLRRVGTPQGCQLLQFVDDGGVVCATDEGLRGYDVHGAERFFRATTAPTTALVAIDADTHVLVANRAGELSVMRGTDGAVDAARSGALGANVTAIALGPDGQRVYAGARDDEAGPRLRVWNATRATTTTDVPWPVAITGLAACPDGSCLVVGGADGTVTWADPDTLAPLRRVEQRRGWALDAVFLTDGRVVVPTSDGSITTWSPFSDVPELSSGRGGVGTIARRRDGRLLVEGREDRRLYIRAGRSLEVRLRMPLTLADSRAFALSPDGRTLVVARDDRSLVWWALGDPELDGLFSRHVGGAAGVVPSRDGAELYTSDNGQLLAWSAVDGAPLRVIAENSELRDGLPQLTLDGSALTWFDRGGAIRSFAVADGRLQRIPTRGVRDLTLLADGDVVGVDTAQQVSRFGVDGTPRWTVGAGYVGVLDTPRQDQIFALTAQGAIHRLDRETGTATPVFDGDADARYIADVTPDGDALMVAASTGEVMVLSARDGAVQRWWKPTTSPTRRFAMSPDRRFFVAGAADQTWVVWDLDQDRIVADLGAQDARLGWAEFSPDGNRLYTSTVDARVRPWDVSVLDHSGASLLADAERRYQLHLDGARLVPLPEG